MKQPIAYHNGELVAAEQLVVRPYDMGFMLGVTVAEQLRTFAGKLRQVDEHFRRLRSSLGITGVDVDLAAIKVAAFEVVEHNHQLLPKGHDLGLTIFVTPGLYPTYAPDGESEPTIGIHTYPLPFKLWAKKYEIGQACEIVSVPQVSEACWPRELKCRSRMHYYLADREAKKRNANARAILLDEAGNLNEASTANVLVGLGSETLVSPRLESILPGISLQHAVSFAPKADLATEFRAIAQAELEEANEMLLTSTPFCVLPVSNLGAKTFEDRSHFEKLIAAWSNEVGFDLVEQACQFAD